MHRPLVAWRQIVFGAVSVLFIHCGVKGTVYTSEGCSVACKVNECRSLAQSVLGGTDTSLTWAIIRAAT
jgi:hypothetical protein